MISKTDRMGETSHKYYTLNMLCRTATDHIAYSSLSRFDPVPSRSLPVE